MSSSPQLDFDSILQSPRPVHKSQNSRISEVAGLPYLVLPQNEDCPGLFPIGVVAEIGELVGRVGIEPTTPGLESPLENVRAYPVLSETLLIGRQPQS